MKDEQSASSATAAISPQSSSKMMTLFLSLIWAEAILYLMSAICYLSNGNLSALACLTYLPQPILSIFLAIHLMSLKSWARKTYIILTAYTILYALTPPLDFVNDNVLISIIDNVALLIGLCCLVLCFNKNVESMYVPDRDSKERVPNNRFQCIVYWVLVVVVMVATGLLRTANDDGENNANEILKEYNDLMGDKEEEQDKSGADETQIDEESRPPIHAEVFRYNDGRELTFELKVSNLEVSKVIVVNVTVQLSDRAESMEKAIPANGDISFRCGTFWGVKKVTLSVPGYEYNLVVEHDDSWGNCGNVLTHYEKQEN